MLGKPVDLKLSPCGACKATGTRPGFVRHGEYMVLRPVPCDACHARGAHINHLQQRHHALRLVPGGQA